MNRCIKGGITFLVDFQFSAFSSSIPTSRIHVKRAVFQALNGGLEGFEDVRFNDGKKGARVRTYALLTCPGVFFPP